MGSPLRILHLEDDRQDAEIIQGVLEGAGMACEVTRVETRDGFVAALESGGFDLILADLSLPSFDGLSALNLALEKRPAVPFIFVSGTLGEEVAIDALKIGATDYILKERLSRLASSVQRALREAGDRAERQQAQQRLRRSEAFLAEGQRISHTGSWGWVLSSGKVFWSEEHYRMLGFVPGPDEPSVELFMSVVHPDDRAQVRAELQAASAARRAYVMSYRVVLPDAGVRHLRSVGRPVADAAGAIDEYIGTTTDITERVQAEAALKRSEERYALAMDAAGEGHWDWDVVTDEFYASPQLLDMYGFAPDTRFPSRAAFLARWPIDPDDRPRFEQAVAAHFSGATARLDLELRMRARGATQWIHVKGLCSRDAGGAPVRWTGTARDITDRKCMELALRKSSERYALAVEAAGEGHSDWNLETGEFDVSPRLLEICGYPPDAAFKDRRDWVERFPFHPEDRPRWEQAVAAHMAGTTSRFRMELRIVVRGEIRWVRFVFLCSRDAAGRAVRWTGSTTDVTDRKRAEEDVLARQEMLELAQQAARAVAFEWRIGAGGGDNRWSTDLDTMYGLAPGAYDGSFETWKALVCAQDWPAVQLALERARDCGDIAAEYRVVHPDGAVHWLQAKGRMLFDAQGAPARIVGFMLDITDRRHAQDELQRLESRLRQAQRLEAMGTLAGGIAHDFNNILGAILGYGEMALRSAARGSRLRHDLESILTAGERGRALVERILLFSRSGVGDRIPVHVQEIVHEALELIGASLPEGITIDAQLRAGRAAMRGDPTQVHQVLMNLATNAVQAMAAGGTLRVALEVVSFHSPHVATTDTIGAGEYIALVVADAGTGIPKDIIERVFDPFFTTKEVGVGTGLGLSLVHGIVSEVGGAIDVDSAPGQGSVFTVYLPRSGDAPDSVGGQAIDFPRGERQQILVVDDEEPLVRLATENLADWGYLPVPFTSSMAALEAFRADPDGYDAVITDERMPEMSGSTLIREIRAIRPTIPTLLVSGYVGAELVRGASAAGADEVLKKPLSMRELATGLARVLEP